MTEPTLDAETLRTQIRQWAEYCFIKYGNDAHLYNGLAALAGMEPAVAVPRPVAGADYTYECGCYWFCGNLVACAKHSPASSAAPRPAAEPGDWQPGDSAGRGEVGEQHGAGHERAQDGR